MLSKRPAVSGEGYDPSIYPLLAKQEDGHFWHRSRAALIAWALRKYFPEAKTFLEVGCGTGNVLSHIAARNPSLDIHGCDSFREGLVWARKRLGSTGTLLCLAAGDLPFDREFDVLGAFDVVEHTEDDAAALRQMHQALVPGGGLLLTVPQHPALWSASDERAHHFRRYTAGGLVAAIERAGFSIVMTTSFVSLLLPAMFVARRWRPKTAARLAIEREMTVNPLANWALYQLMSMERSMIAAGVRFALGGSRLVVATKN